MKNKRFKSVRGRINPSTMYEESTVRSKALIENDNQEKMSEEDIIVEQYLEEMSDANKVIPKSHRCWPSTKFFTMY